MKIPPDNPAWHALSTLQNHFNCGHELLKFFPADVSPFVGMEHWDEKDLTMLMNDLPRGRSFSVMIAKQVCLPVELEIVFTCPLYRMECNEEPAMPGTGLNILKLERDNVPQMLELTGKTKPGPFLARTIEMGNYYGIFEHGQLAAMAGERLRLPGYTEVSAICTDPAFLGLGYASHLTTYAVQQIFEKGGKPFLHVKTDNLRAIEVYRRIGFEVSAEVFFAIFKKNPYADSEKG